MTSLYGSNHTEPLVYTLVTFKSVIVCWMFLEAESTKVKLAGEKRWTHEM